MPSIASNGLREVEVVLNIGKISMVKLVVDELS